MSPLNHPLLKGWQIDTRSYTPADEAELYQKLKEMGFHWNDGEMEWDRVKRCYHNTVVVHCNIWGEDTYDTRLLHSTECREEFGRILTLTDIRRYYRSLKQKAHEKDLFNQPWCVRVSELGAENATDVLLHLRLLGISTNTHQNRSLLHTFYDRIPQAQPLWVIVTPYENTSIATISSEKITEPSPRALPKEHLMYHRKSMESLREVFKTENEVHIKYPLHQEYEGEKLCELTGRQRGIGIIEEPNTFLKKTCKQRKILAPHRCIYVYGKTDWEKLKGVYEKLRTNPKYTVKYNGTKLVITITPEIIIFTKRTRTPPKEIEKQWITSIDSLIRDPETNDRDIEEYTISQQIWLKNVPDLKELFINGITPKKLVKELKTSLYII
jgi:hypothetical protein